MKLSSKKTTLIMLGIASLLISRLIFFFINDPEGPNLLIVVGLASLIFGFFLLIYLCMKKQQMIKIIRWSSIALIVPILGQLFVDGWNWKINDFVFAWVFFNLLGVTYSLITNKITHRGMRMGAGLCIVAIFAFIWIRLATG